MTRDVSHRAKVTERAEAKSDDLDERWAVLETEPTTEEIRTAIRRAAPDEVVCRECGRTMGQITEQHLRTHGSTLAAYRAGHPGAPVYPNAPERSPGREPGFDHPPETKQKIAESIARKHEEGAYE